MKLPNILTLFRIALIPVFMTFFYFPFESYHIIAAIIFALAGITDWLDGYLARKWNQTSQFGAFLDPVADKLLVVVALVLLVSRPYLMYISFPAAVMVGRELIVCAVREWMAEFGKKTKVAVLYVAKLKTTMQFISIIVLIAYTPKMPLFVKYFGCGLFYFAAALTLWTLLIYIKIALFEFGWFREKGK